MPKQLTQLLTGLCIGSMFALLVILSGLLYAYAMHGH